MDSIQDKSSTHAFRLGKETQGCGEIARVRHDNDEVDPHSGGWGAGND